MTIEDLVKMPSIRTNRVQVLSNPDPAQSARPVVCTVSNLGLHSGSSFETYRILAPWQSPSYVADSRVYKAEQHIAGDHVRIFESYRWIRKRGSL